MNKSKLVAKWQLRKDVYEATFLEASPDLQKLVKELFDAKIEIFSEFINDLKNLDGDTVKLRETCPECNSSNYHLGIRKTLMICPDCEHSEKAS